MWAIWGIFLLFFNANFFAAAAVVLWQIMHKSTHRNETGQVLYIQSCRRSIFHIKCQDYKYKYKCIDLIL